MNCTDLHVVVAGAAIGGTATALLLANAGARVTLVEKIPAPTAVGAALLLQPNGLAVLAGLGLSDRLHLSGVELRQATIADTAGRPLLVADIPTYGRGLDHALVIRRSDLLNALLDRVARHPRIALRFGTAITAATPNGHVTLDHDGRPDTLVADLVVAADGLHSTIRDQGRFGATVRPGIEYVRALGRLHPLVGAIEYWTPLGLFGMAPLRDVTYCYASAGAPPLAAALQARDLDAFRRAWSTVLPIAGELLRDLTSIEQLLINRVERVDCARFVDGRVVLLGDAAHAMAPNLGQGANSALVDAVVLVDAVRRAPDLGSALLTYDMRRRPAVRKIQETADQLARAAELRHPLAQWLRNTGVRIAGRVLNADRAARAAQQEEPAWLFDTARSSTPLTTSLPDDVIGLR